MAKQNGKMIGGKRRKKGGRQGSVSAAGRGNGGLPGKGGPADPGGTRRKKKGGKIEKIYRPKR